MNIIELAKQAGFFIKDNEAYSPSNQEDHKLTEFLEHFAELVAAKERELITKMLNYLDMKAQPYHNYYKHAAVEINRKKDEGEKI